MQSELSITIGHKSVSSKIVGLRVTVWPSNGDWEYRFMIDVTVPEIMKKLYSFNMHGFMHAPMAAKLMTELILDGASTTLDINQFSIDRFRTGKLLPTTRLI